MGNYPSICGVNGGVIVNDNGEVTCYTSSVIVNVTNLQSVQSSDNTAVQAYVDYDGEGSMVPLYSIGYTSQPIRSLRITVHWTRTSMFFGFIITIIIIFLISYMSYSGYKKYKNYTSTRTKSNTIDDMPELEPIDTNEDSDLLNSETSEGGKQIKGGLRHGYFSMQKYKI
jgi:hypothetical protein